MNASATGKILLLATLLLRSAGAQAQTTITSFDSLWRYATANSSTLRTNDIRLRQARQSRLAALLSVPDVGGSLSGTYTDNTRLPVNLFPAEAFGGPPGTYREVQTGVRFNTTFNEQVDVKLVNIKGWKGLQLARIEIESTEADNALSRHQLQQNLVAVYFNILQLNEQLSVAQEQAAVADTLLALTRQQQREGIVNQQTVNEAEVVQVNNAQLVAQLRFNREGQYLTLKALCDIPGNTELRISGSLNNLASEPVSAAADILQLRSYRLQEQKARSQWRQQKASLYPTLSFFQSYSSQQFGEKGARFDQRWIPSSYVGLRLLVNIPNATTVSQISKARFDWLTAQERYRQQEIQANVEAARKNVELQEARQQAETQQRLLRLREDNWRRNHDLYREGLTGWPALRDSYLSYLDARYQLLSAQASLAAAQERIRLQAINQ